MNNDCRCKLMNVKCKNALRILSFVAVVVTLFFVLYLDKSLQILPFIN